MPSSGRSRKAFRRGGSWASAKPGKVRVASGRHGGSDIVIEVPRAISGRFEIHTASGDLRIEDVTGEITLKTVSGDVRVVRTAGDLTLQTASGDLAIEGATGRLTAHTVSGDVRVTSAQSDGFQIQTANGDILLDALLAGDGPFHAQTASGDVRLTLRRPAADGEEPAATLAFQTVSGDAHVTPPFRKTDRRLWQAGPGDRRTAHRGHDRQRRSLRRDCRGGERIRPRPQPGCPLGRCATRAARTARAGSCARSAIATNRTGSTPVDWPRGEFAPAATDAGPEAAQPAAPDDAARLAVLEAVERGEIDVEEALRRLEAADRHHESVGADDPPGRRSPINQQSQTVEETAMYRSNWELAAYVRHHIADLADECQACSPIDRDNDGSASLVTQLRHRLGIALIQIGHALAGYDALRGFPTPPARPAT